MNHATHTHTHTHTQNIFFTVPGADPGFRKGGLININIFTTGGGGGGGVGEGACPLP